MDIAKSIFSHRDREGYVGKEDHNVSKPIIASHIKLTFAET